MFVIRIWNLYRKLIQRLVMNSFLQTVRYQQKAEPLTADQMWRTDQQPTAICVYFKVHV